MDCRSIKGNWEWKRGGVLDEKGLEEKVLEGVAMVIGGGCYGDGDGCYGDLVTVAIVI